MERETDKKDLVNVTFRATRGFYDTLVNLAGQEGKTTTDTLRDAIVTYADLTRRQQQGANILIEQEEGKHFPRTVIREVKIK